jgi:precorrin-3B C17-methyltransferase
MSYKAHRSIREAEVIVGYDTYIELIRDIISPGQEIVGTGMTQELARCTEAVKHAAAGKKVAVVSSGDAGIYGMAGVILELIYKMRVQEKVVYEVIPGISAVNAAAAALGAPLMHDFAVISLSDLLTPWEKIKERVACAAKGDFVLALYNPKSTKRVWQIEEVREILLKYRSAQTPVGIVRNAKRADEHIIVTNLDEFTGQTIDMFSLVLIGNTQTYVLGGKIVTPRGYQL